MDDIKTYLLSIFATALLITVVDILAPSSVGSGLSKYLKLVLSFVFVCVLISPTVSFAEHLLEFANGNWEFGVEEDIENQYATELQNALDDASKDYFEGMLNQTLCKEFEIADGDLRTHVEWSGDGENLRPKKVTLILSGKAIWKDAGKMEAYVTSLLECDCVSAIE